MGITKSFIRTGVLVILVELLSGIPAQADPMTIGFSGVFSEMPIYKDGDPGNPVLFEPGSILELAPSAVYVLVSGLGWQLIPNQLYPLMHTNSFSGQGIYDPVLQNLISFQMNVGGQAFTESNIQPLHLSEESLEFGFFGEVISEAFTPKITEVPEPGSLVLLICGFTALFVHARAGMFRWRPLRHRSLSRDRRV